MPWKDDRRMVALPPVVYQRLAAWKKRLVETADVGKMRQWWEGDDGPTYAEMIGRLLDMMAGKRSRSLRSRRRRRAEAIQAMMDWRPWPVE